MYNVPMYTYPFYLTDKISSNAFSFEKRTNPKLYVPSVIEGGLKDVQETKWCLKTLMSLESYSRALG